MFVAHQYLGTLLQEAAKDHYPVFKRALSRLVRRTTGKDREIRLQIVTPTSAKVRTGDPVVLSIWAKLRDGRSVSFIFEHSVPDEAVPLAVEGVLDLLINHHAERGRDELASAPTALPSGGWAPVVMRFDQSRRWGPWTLSADASPVQGSEAQHHSD